MTSFPELIGQYLAGTDSLRQAVAGMTREQLLAKPIADKWSTLEVVAHIADFEPILADRMKRILALERPLLLVADENLFVHRLAYDERDLDEELDLIAATRKQMARILNNVKPSDAINRAGVHSLKGLVTLEAVLSSAVNHIPHHLPFIEAKRKALGI